MSATTDLTITSDAFAFGERIPERHVKDGENLSPALNWRGVPEGARELAVICHDPDAPMLEGFTHWLVYRIPATAEGLEEARGREYTEGTNDFGEIAYGGPKPPPGHGPHHYYFWIYALSAEIDAGPGLSRRQFIEHYGHTVIAQNRLVGIYER